MYSRKLFNRMSNQESPLISTRWKMRIHMFYVYVKDDLWNEVLKKYTYTYMFLSNCHFLVLISHTISKLVFKGILLIS